MGSCRVVIWRSGFTDVLAPAPAHLPMGGVVAYGDVSLPHPAAPLKSFFYPFNPHPSSQAPASSWPSQPPLTALHRPVPASRSHSAWSLHVYLGLLIVVLWGYTYRRQVLSPPLGSTSLAASDIPAPLSPATLCLQTGLWILLTCLHRTMVLVCLLHVILPCWMCLPPPGCGWEKETFLVETIPLIAV